MLYRASCIDFSFTWVLHVSTACSAEYRLKKILGSFANRAIYRLIFFMGRWTFDSECMEN